MHFVVHCGMELLEYRRLVTKSRLIYDLALIAKQLTRPDHCLWCGLKCKPEGHHTDYRRPLRVEWICIACHKKEHARLGRLHYLTLDPV